MIEIRGLDSDFNICALLDPVNIQWNTKYYEYGNCIIQIPISQYSTDIQYIYSSDRRELGVVKKMNYETDVNNFKYVILNCYFYENELNREIVNPTFQGNGNTEDEITRMVVANKGDITLTVATSQGRGTDTLFSDLGTELAEQCYYILKLHEMSFKVDYDLLTNEFIFSIFEGLDRTQEQSDNEPLTFSTEFDNLESPTLLIDDSSYKTHALLIVKDGYENQTVSIDDTISVKKWTTIDCSSVEYIDTDANYYADVKAYGLSALKASFASKVSVSGDAVAASYTYLKDYSCGDKCNLVISELGIVVETRIIEVNEVFKDNEHTITLQFGDKIIEE
ncbi:MAG: hypothetical protein R3Y58_08695 [Eubacteriales bacterium]